MKWIAIWVAFECPIFLGSLPTIAKVAVCKADLRIERVADKKSAEALIRDNAQSTALAWVCREIGGGIKCKKIRWLPVAEP